MANDSPELPKIQARLQAQGTVPGEQYVDQGYVSGKRIADSRRQGIDLVGRPLGDTQGPEGFRQVAFRIDETAREAICPAGQVSVVWSERQAGEGEPAGIEVRFDAKTCRACPSFGSCTNSGQGRSLQLHPYRQVLEARRAEAETGQYRAKLRLRAGIEGTISELVRGHRLRFARYRGLEKLRLQELFTGVAVNFKRLAKWWARPAGRTAMSSAN